MMTQMTRCVIPSSSTRIIIIIRSGQTSMSMRAKSLAKLFFSLLLLGSSQGLAFLVATPRHSMGSPHQSPSAACPFPGESTSQSCRRRGGLFSAGREQGAGALGLRATLNAKPMTKQIYPPLPVVLGDVGSPPLLPGGLIRLVNPSVFVTNAIELATTFSALDSTFGSSPLLVYLAQPQEQQDERIRGIASLVAIDDIRFDGEGKTISAALTGVGRALVTRVKLVNNNTLVVADRWTRVVDDQLPMSYMHTLEALREVADQASFEHNNRRRLISSVTAKTQELKLCDMEGICDMDALLELGPEVYAKAMELAASATVGGAKEEDDAMSVSYALYPLEQLARASVQRASLWDSMWPQWGDSIDNEVRHLRAMSFSAWRSLSAVVPDEVMFEVLASTNCLQRLKMARERLYRHRLELQEAEKVLVKLQQGVAAAQADSD